MGFPDRIVYIYIYSHNKMNQQNKIGHEQQTPVSSWDYPVLYLIHHFETWVSPQWFFRLGYVGNPVFVRPESTMVGVVFVAAHHQLCGLATLVGCCNGQVSGCKKLMKSKSRNYGEFQPTLIHTLFPTKQLYRLTIGMRQGHSVGNQGEAGEVVPSCSRQ